MWGFTPHPTRDDVPQPQSTPWSLALPMLVSVDSFGFLRLSAAPSTGGPVASFTLDPSCGWNGLILQTLCRRSRNILIQKGRKTANFQCINTPLPIFNSCTNEILHSSFFILNLSHPPRAGGVPPPAGCCASGENRKRPGESLLSHRPFFMFSVRPWGLFRSFLSALSVGKQFFVVHNSAVSPLFRRKLFVRQINPFACRVQGGTPCRRGSGDEQSPASFLRNRRKLFVCTHNHFACRVQG